MLHLKCEGYVLARNHTSDTTPSISGQHTQWVDKTVINIFYHCLHFFVDDVKKGKTINVI